VTENLISNTVMHINLSLNSIRSISRANRMGPKCPLRTDPRPWIWQSNAVGRGATLLFPHSLHSPLHLVSLLFRPLDPFDTIICFYGSHLIVLHFLLTSRTINAPKKSATNVIYLFSKSPLCDRLTRTDSSSLRRHSRSLRLLVRSSPANS
jgi:hypothetical protein